MKKYIASAVLGATIFVHSSAVRSGEKSACPENKAPIPVKEVATFEETRDANGTIIIKVTPVLPEFNYRVTEDGMLLPPKEFEHDK